MESVDQLGCVPLLHDYQNGVEDRLGYKRLAAKVPCQQCHVLQVTTWHSLELWAKRQGLLAYRFGALKCIAPTWLIPISGWVHISDTTPETVKWLQIHSFLNRGRGIITTSCIPVP
ncbi:unnamed protein product [Dovyalis caffra]|uniref:Uncharacterized protein n=1 Tax=Dovyalis caffra TaxID=77055 RepID=A0AAV1SCJ3_9ROSI|nr:unnamed protein product [Dovyalis caffra]